MSPRSSKRIKELREEKMTLIMDVALNHFANHGFKATTINHIAQHAGISKGLMYNYFKSKEDLLASIIEKSVSELYDYFDVNRDGYLTQEEFEFFIRKAARVLNEKQPFWRLFFQVLLQNEVRINFMNSFLGTESLITFPQSFSKESFISQIMRIITDYFIRKKTSRGPDYDPYLELNMFLITLKGFAITYIYTEEENDEYFDKTVNYIIDIFK